jgi:hypothetical protein
MSRLNKIVTSQVDSSTGTQHDTNTYSYDSNGILVRHDDDRVGKSVVGPGVLYGANKDSAEQTGLNTIKLIPNEDLATDQFLVIEPTSPNHIHIRAGGTQDDSNALLILGGERNAVLVGDDYRSVGISTRYARVQNTYLNTNPASTDTFWTGSTADIQTGYTVTIDNVDYVVSQITAVDEGVIGVKATGALFTAGTSYTFYFDPPWNHQWTFNSNGVIQGPAMGGTRFTQIRNAGSGENLGIYSDDAALDLQATNELNITATDGNVNIAAQGGGKISLSGTDGAYLGNPDVPYNRITTRQEVPFINAAVPTSSIGQEGDVVGFGSMTSGYIYYCTGTYDGTTHIWKRVAWSNDTWGV